jgi:hypothetical protein
VLGAVLSGLDIELVVIAADALLIEGNVIAKKLWVRLVVDLQATEYGSASRSPYLCETPA